MHNTFSSQPLVSIITPNFNGERFIRRVVESVRQQNYPVEHIIVDDFSTDGSWALLQDLSKVYSWLKPVRLGQNSGSAIARNRAIDLAQGRFLAFLDVDDFWLPHKLQIQIEFMLSIGCGLSFSDYRFVSEDGRKIGCRLKGFNQIGWHLHHMTRYLGCLTIVLDREKYSDFEIPNISRDMHVEDILACSAYIQRHGTAFRCPHDLARYAVVEKSQSSGKIRQAVSVWKLYRDIESIALPSALFYFIVYALGVFWKRYWYRPFMKRAEVDHNFEWSLLPETEEKCHSPKSVEK
jgi:teichuronic acid biosynthesis glycosyltransferase TuaG